MQPRKGGKKCSRGKVTSDAGVLRKKQGKALLLGGLHTPQMSPVHTRRTQGDASLPGLVALIRIVSQSSLFSQSGLGLSTELEHVGANTCHIRKDRLLFALHYGTLNYLSAV
jgi:hypothetical protein